MHYYQPLWTLVGGGRAPLRESGRPMGKLIPKGVDWIRDAGASIDPEGNTVTTAKGATLSYDHLVVCPGIQLDWAKVLGMPESLDTPLVSSNYSYDMAPKTWANIEKMCSGTAVFTMPAGPIKCAGAPQKIAYLAADYWRQQGVLEDIRVVLVLPTPGMFGVPVFAEELERVVKHYGIEVHKSSEAVEIDAAGRQVVVADNASGTKESIGYDFMHVVPPQSAPDWIKSTPNSKTGAAIRKQAPVVATNLTATMSGKQPTAQYDGYASCPLTTARNKVLLAEFDYTMEPAPTFPVIDATKSRRDMWYLKRYGLPFMYWNLMLKGRA